MFAVGLGTTVMNVVVGVVISAPKASVIMLIVTETDPVFVIVPILNGAPLTAVALAVIPLTV